MSSIIGAIRTILGWCGCGCASAEADGPQAYEIGAPTGARDGETPAAIERALQQQLGLEGGFRRSILLMAPGPEEERVEEA